MYITLPKASCRSSAKQGRDTTVFQFILDNNVIYKQWQNDTLVVYIGPGHITTKHKGYQSMDI